MVICNTFQMIEQLSEDRTMKFARVGDESFIVSASPMGGLIVTIGEVTRPMSILNYLHEYWTEVIY